MDSRLRKLAYSLLSYLTVARENFRRPLIPQLNLDLTEKYTKILSKV